MSGIILGERRVSHEALLDRAARAAAGFRSVKIGAGDTVLVLLRNDFAFLEASLAAGLVGAHPVAGNWHWTAAEVAYIVADAQPRAIVVHADMLEAFAPALPRDVTLLVATTPPEIAEAYGAAAGLGALPPGARSWDDWIESHAPLAQATAEPASTIIYTSGTTGKPKGVRRQPPTAEQSRAATEIIGKAYGLRAEEGLVTLVAAPLYHSAPNTQGLFGVKVGATLVLEPRFDAERMLRLIERWRVTHLYAAPIMFVRLLQLPREVREKYDLSSLQFVVHAAAPCPVEVKRAMIDWWGPVIHEFYGSTETRAVTCCTAEEWLQRPGTVGRAIEGAVVRVVDENGQDQPPGVPGEVLSRHWDVADFTYQNDDAKRRAMERFGLLSVGDVGYLDEDGYLFLCDRSSDMIISGGVNIYPAEIEAALLQVSGVEDCAVFGAPDAEYGEAVVAVVQPLDNVELDADVLRAELRARIAGYKVPRRIDFAQELPREDSGKIFKRKLKESYWRDTGRRI
ncbi:MAG TPA: acyl-CoA synthetase [Caulobacteraceae bacterium]|nr:acyl-CoA synthetase [Caulobacteraceae bacterium]